MLSPGATPEQLFLIAETGYHLIREGRNEEAIAVFEGLALIDESADYYRLALAAAHVQAGNPDRAVSELDGLLRRTPQHVEALVQRCLAQLRRGDLNAAANDIATLRSLGALDEAEDLWDLIHATPARPAR